jgi:hypothetical protein
VEHPIEEPDKECEGPSTSSEKTPEYFGAKGALSLKNGNIMCDTTLILDRCLLIEKLSHKKNFCKMGYD